MAAGLPAVITDMGGNSDIIKTEADGGLLVTYNDPDSMAGAMKRFLEDRDLLARCRENALRTVAEKFEIHKMCAATFEEYQKACQ